jgi:hypothetical protein
MMRILPLLVLALAGCLHADHEESTAGPGEPGPAASSELSLAECSIMLAYAEWPGESGPGTSPPGWEAGIQRGALGSRDFMEIFDCREVTWGSREQSLVFLIEAHNKIMAPETCRWEGSEWMMHRILVGDPGFAAFLRDQVHLPSLPATFEATYENGTELTRLTWTWQAEGVGRSELTTLVAAPEPQVPHYKTSHRYFADRGNGITALDLEIDAEVPTSPEQAAFGMLDPSMLHASSGVTAFVGQADYMFGGHARGAVSTFDDYLCEQPMDAAP